MSSGPAPRRLQERTRPRGPNPATACRHSGSAACSAATWTRSSRRPCRRSRGAATYRRPSWPTTSRAICSGCRCGPDATRSRYRASSSCAGIGWVSRWRRWRSRRSPPAWCSRSSASCAPGAPRRWRGRGGDGAAGIGVPGRAVQDQRSRGGPRQRGHGPGAPGPRRGADRGAARRPARRAGEAAARHGPSLR